MKRLIAALLLTAGAAYGQMYRDGYQTTKTIVADADTGITASVDDDGHLQVANQHDGLAIAEGAVTGVSFIHKFGEAPDFDLSDSFVNIWDGANDAGIDAMTYTYSNTTNIDSLISSSASDVGTVSVQGLDVDWAITNQTVTLTGQTRVALPTPLRRVFRMINTSSNDWVGNISCYTTNSTTTAGVVNNKAAVRAHVVDGNNQTLMAVYTIPAGKTGYMRSWYASISGGNKTSNYKIRLRARPFGQVFQLKHTAAIAEGGTSSIQHTYVEPEVFAEKTDIELRVSATANVTGCAVSGGFDIVLVDN